MKKNNGPVSSFYYRDKAKRTTSSPNRRVRNARSSHKTPSLPAKTTAAPATANTPSNPSTPSNSTDTVYYGSGPSMSGSSSTVFLLMMFLLVLVFWNNLIVPVASIAWDPNSKQDITSMPWTQFLSASVFVVIVTFIAGISDEAGGSTLLFVLALYVVYFVETQGGIVTQFANWANPAKQSTQTQKPGKNPALPQQ